MISYKITFDAWDGKPQTETYFFNISEAELTLLNARYGGSFANTLARLQQQGSDREAMDIWMDILRTAYGRMDDDQVHFRKDEACWNDFISTEGFNKFFMQIMTSDEEMVKFIRGILPRKVAEAMDADTDGGTKPSAKLIELQTADVTIS